jgi:hypothetical protein
VSVVPANSQEAKRWICGITGIHDMDTVEVDGYFYDVYHIGCMEMITGVTSEECRNHAAMLLKVADAIDKLGQ